jgi:thymidylate kinase
MNLPLKIAARLFDILEKEGIRYCLWKSNQHLAEALTGQTDMDLLVEQNRSARFECILTELGYKRFISQPWARYPGIEDWIGFDNETGKLVHVHLHYQLVMGRKFVKEHHLPWEDMILKTAIKDPEFKVFITDPNLEMILLSIRIGLKIAILDFISAFPRKSPLDKNLLKEFNYLSQRVEVGLLQEYASQLFGKLYGQQFCTIITQEDIRKPEVVLRIKAIVNKVLDKHRRFNRTGASGIYVYRMVQSLLAKASGKLGTYRQNGKRMLGEGSVIAIIGCDGSGKSTVSSEIKQWLAWKVDTHRIYLGSGDGPIGLPVRLFKSLALRTRRKKVNRQTNGTHWDSKTGDRKLSLFKELGSCLLDLSIANDKYRKVKEANQVRIKGGIVITDRYPQNQFLGIYDGPRVSQGNGKSGLQKFFVRLEEQKYQEMAKLSPDVVVKLHIPLEVVLLRKPGHNVDNIRRKAEITSELRFLGAKVIDIDASKPVADVLNSIKKGIWESI